jgi:hypothetical protein
MIFFRIAVSIFAVLLIGFGAVLTISPIPFGLILVVIGFLLFVTAAPAEVRWLRRRWRWFDRMMHRLENRLPEWMAKRLRNSDYDHEEEERKERDEEVRQKREMRL